MSMTYPFKTFQWILWGSCLILSTPLLAFEEAMVPRADFSGTYDYSMNVGGETTFKVGESHWYKHRDRLTVGRQVHSKTEPTTISAQGNGSNYLGYISTMTCGHKFETRLVSTQGYEHHFAKGLMTGFFEAQAQPANEYHFNHVMGQGHDWKLGLSYFLNFDVKIHQIVILPQPDWDFVYVIPMNVQSTQVTGTGLSEVFSGGLEDIYSLDIPKSGDASNCESLDDNLGWKGQFSEDASAQIRGFLPSIEAKAVALEGQLSIDQLIGVPQEYVIDIRSVSQGALKNADTAQWKERIAYRGVWLKPLEVEPLPGDTNSDYFLDGLGSQMDVLTLIKRVVQFERWVFSTRAAFPMELMHIAQALRSTIIDVIQDSSRPTLRNSVRMKLFALLNRTLFFLPRMSLMEQAQLRESQKETTGQTMDQMMDPGVSDVSGVKAVVESWVKDMEEKGLGEFSQDVKTTLEQTVEDVNVDFLKQQLLDQMRAVGHQLLESKGSIEAFIQKVEADHELLESEQINLQEIQP